MKTYKFTYEVEALGMSGIVEEIATVSSGIIKMVEELAQDNDMVNIISIEEVQETPSKSGFMAGLMGLLGK